MALYGQCRAGAQINFPESGRGLGHVTPTIFGSTVGYPSDSLASCSVMSVTVQNPYCTLHYIRNAACSVCCILMIFLSPCLFLLCIFYIQHY